MKSTMGMLLGLALLVPAVSFAADGLTGDEVLRKVGQTYAALRSFRLVRSVDVPDANLDRFTTANPAPAPLGYGKGRYRTDLTESEPGNLRLVLTYGQNTILVVADASQTWLYLSNLNQYAEYAAAPLLKQVWARYPELWAVPGELWAMYLQFPLYTPFGEDDLAAYAALSVLKGGARLRRVQTLPVGAEEVPCYVVSVPPKRQLQTLWVDKERFLVVRDERAPFRLGAWSSQLESVDLGPQPKSAFQFAAPTGARRVDSFGPPKGEIQQDEVWLADHLLGADRLRAMEGGKAPDFAAQDLSARTVRLGDLRGKIVLLDFFATWCEPCQQDLAAVQKLHAELGGKGVAFLGIDEGEDRETVKSFLKKNGYTFPSLLDSAHVLPAFYRTGWVPTVIVINRKGKIATQYIGAGGEAQLRQALIAAGLDTTKP